MAKVKKRLGLNLSKIKSEKDNRGGGDKYFKKSELNEDGVDLRFLEPSDDLDGMFAHKRIGYWIDGEYLLSTSTFGEDCQISPILDEIKAEHPETAGMMQRSRKFKKDTEYASEVVVLDVEYDEDDPDIITKQTVRDKCVKIFAYGPQLNDKIIEVLNSRLASKIKSDYSVMDHEKGHNIICGRSGEKINTVYSAEIEPTQSSVTAIVKDLERHNLIDDARKKLKPTEYVRAYLYHYFLGEDKPNIADYIEDKAKTNRKPSKKIVKNTIIKKPAKSKVSIKPKASTKKRTTKSIKAQLEEEE